LTQRGSGGYLPSLRYAVADLVSVLLWAREGDTTVTVDWLADRMLTSAETVREVLQQGVADNVLEPVTGTDGPLDPVIRRHGSRR
jgi:hypothetical protein